MISLFPAVFIIPLSYHLKITIFTASRNFYRLILIF